MIQIPRKIIRAMGFTRECQGLIDRYINVEGAWDSHIKQSKDFILEILKGTKIENLAVYGSGWLLDLPLEELTEIAECIRLYDIEHPQQIRERTVKFKNVKLIQADITGGGIMNAVKAVKEYRRSKTKTPPEMIADAQFEPEVKPDYIISLNMLSQTGVMLTDYLMHTIPYSAEEITKINRLLQLSHMQLLIPGKSCLITDYRELHFSFSGEQTGAKDLISIPLPESKHKQHWDWQFDPQGGYLPDTKTILQVIACVI